MFTIGVRYCGGCNPEIDRTGIVGDLEEALAGRGLETVFASEGKSEMDLLLLVNGCKHACLEEEYQGTDEGPRVLSVKGEMVGTRYVREKDIPEFLTGKIVDLIVTAQ